MTYFRRHARHRLRPSRPALLVAVLAAAVPLAVQAPTAAADGRVTIDEFFVIGVDSQYSSSFETWKSRGINTAVRKRPSESIATFDAAATAAGLRAIRNTLDPYADATASHLIATLYNDEPELNHCSYAEGRDAMFAARSFAAPTGVPFFTNYSGPWILEDPPLPATCDLEKPKDYCGIKYHSPNQWCYGEYFRATDWISFDIFPRNNANDINEITAVMDRIKAAYEGTASPLKPLLTYIEASNARCDDTYPNQWHVVYEAVQAIVGGSRGIIYFPHGLSPCPPGQFGADNTTLRIQEEMTRLNTALARVPGPTMQGTVNPSGVRFESGTTSGQIISGTRSDATHAYYFTANNHGSSAYTHTVRFHGLTNCAGKQVTVLNDQVVSNTPYVYVDRVLTLNGSCMPVGPDGVPVTETWSAYRYHIYQVALN